MDAAPLVMKTGFNNLVEDNEDQKYNIIAMRKNVGTKKTPYV